MNYSKVEGYSHLRRDENTNSIINTNISEYQEYISRRDSKNEENQKVQTMEEELTNIKSDINEIKTLLRSLLTNESRSN